ncbi:MAG: sulfatase-like hydrolase/transferase [Opitutaceae bacterium]
MKTSTLLRSSLRAVVLTIFLPLCGHAGDDPRPNILFILADDLGWGDPSCYGNKQFKTPALDRLASEGALFTQYYQGASVCSPSRCTLMTGRWPAELRLHGHLDTAERNTERDMAQCLDPQVATLPRLLHSAGYFTAHIGKWHLGRPLPAGAGLSDYGFEETRWLDAEGDLAGEDVNLWTIKHRPHASRVLVDAVLDVLQHAKEMPARPFYCQLWLNDPHAPLAPSVEQMHPFHGYEPDGITTPFAVYAATVTEMDRQIGRLLAKLDELGFSRNTIVIFSSDNGPEDIEIINATWSGIGSAGPLRGRKRSIYDGGIRVPLLVRWPGVLPAGQVNARAVISGADWLPTLCALAGVSMPDATQATQRGENVAAALKGDLSFRRTRPLFWEWRFQIVNHPWNHSPILAIRDGGWKLLLNPDHSRIELYDMDADPGEQDNLASQHPDLVARLSAQALAWQKTLPPGVIEPGAGKCDYPWPKAAATGRLTP